MSRPRSHPVDHLVQLAEEAAQIMWRCYEEHLHVSRYDYEWKLKGEHLFARCTAGDERVARIRKLRETIGGPKGRQEPACRGATEEANGREKLEEAEWQVRKLRQLLEEHREAKCQDAKWKEQELRLMDGLKKALGELAVMMGA